MPKKVNWFERIKVGDKFGRLTVIELPDDINCHSKIHCKCECGNDTQVQLKCLLYSEIKSCGCLQKESVSRIGKLTGKTTIKIAHEAHVKSIIDNSIFHGDTHNGYYKVAYFFRFMHNRANGIYKPLGRTVCDEWSYTENGYNNFKQWLLSDLSRLNLTLDDFNSMHNRELSVDRIDNSKGYSPVNCRLATPKQQARNRSNSHKYFGVSIYDIADRYDIPYSSMLKAYKTNNIEELLEEYTEMY